MKKIFMLLAIAGIFGVTSCGGVCSCLDKAGFDEAAIKACFDDGTSNEDMLKLLNDCKKMGDTEEEIARRKEAMTLTDSRDNKTYKTVKIGNQVWMAENLAFKPSSGNYSAFDGDNTNHVVVEEHRENIKSYVAKYGYVYDWETACKVCPDGWHLPSELQWEILKSHLVDRSFLGGEDVAGTKMKSTSEWKADGNGTNESGFNGLPGGIQSAGGFSYVGVHGYWWSSKKNRDNKTARNCHLSYDNGYVWFSSERMNHGLSVRCIKD